jgi:tetratricopeptide (TPR) repeat protein
MSSPASNDAVRIAAGATVNVLRTAALCLMIGSLTACGTAARRPLQAPPAQRTATPASAPAAVPAATPVATGSSAAAPAPGVVAKHPAVPPAARADFDRAVNFMRVGNITEAELGFKQVALQYPQFAAPLVNVAILKRKQGELPEAEQLLHSAVAQESGNAVAWTELGATQSLRGEFKEASSSYQSAIAADPRYAPAWRNLGVVQDLYLGDAHSALTSFEQYKQLSGEDKPVSGWIAELRQRLGVAPVKAPAAQAPAPAGDASGAPAPTPAAPTPAKGGN